MTQPPENDEESRYDIDLGVVFEEDDAAGPRTTRDWVRDAIARKATNLKTTRTQRKSASASSMRTDISATSLSSAVNGPNWVGSTNCRPATNGSVLILPR